MKKIKRLKKETILKLQRWSHEKLFGIFSFNVLLMLLVLLHTAGYFDPFIPLTINLIFFISIIMATIFLGFRSRGFFILAFVFLFLAMFFRSLSVNIWAERAGIYTFEALFVGVLLLIFENINL